MNHPRVLAWRALCCAAALVSLSACPRFGEVCGTGLRACAVEGEEEKVCVDSTRDTAHCGGCGIVCGDGSVCTSGACVCAPGFTLCGDTCVNLQESASSCGACGTVCGAEQVCDQGQCVVSCPAEKTQCGQSCVELDTSEAHCGACGRACQNATSCHQGRCEYDVVVACSTNGQLVGIQAGTDLLGPATHVGTSPLAVAPFRDAFVVGDNDQTLYEVAKDSFARLDVEAAVGSDARFLHVEDPFVYVVNSVTGTLQIFEAVAADAGHALELRKELPLSTSDQGNTFAQGLTKQGHIVYVSLQGGFGPGAAAGQQVVRFDVTDPSAPLRLEPIDLTTLDLKAFDGGTTLPRPGDVAAHDGKVYVALPNFDENYKPAGAPLVARFDPADGGLDAIDLGRERCLGPTELVTVGHRLLVSCYGRVEYDQTWTASEVNGSGVVVLGAEDQVESAWPLRCPDDAGAGCQLAIAGRLAVSGGSVYLGDANRGRIFVLQLDGGTLTERRGFRSSPPLEACPVGSVGFSMASDVVANP